MISKRLAGLKLKVKNRGGRISPVGTARWIELKNVPCDVVWKGGEILHYKVLHSLLMGRTRGVITWEMRKESMGNGNKA